MSPILSQEEVIYRCKQVHGDKYDYSKVVYKGSHKKLIIICRIHGEFQQTYNKHFYSKTGCYYCGKEKSSKYRTLSQDVAIAQCKDIHGDKYHYSKSIYKDSAYRKIIIICKIHGESTQTHASHIKGSGCPLCAKNQHGKILILTQEEVIKRCINTHGNKYDYSKSVYKDSHTKMSIGCLINPEHGVFKQTYANHIPNGGCPKCGYEKTRSALALSQKDVIYRCRQVHGDKYDYSNVKYINAHTKIKIQCLVNLNHGNFYQTYASHINGAGCPICGTENNPGVYTYSLLENNLELKNKPAIYYMFLLSNKNEKFIKKGITIQNSSKNRSYSIPYTVEILKEEYMSLYDAFCKEQEEKEKYKHLKYEPIIHFGGHTECFTLEILQQ